MQPVQLADLVSATRATATGLVGGAQAVRRISVDSRTLCEGDLFWALPGKTRDGHEFVGAALARGAVGCVIERNRIDSSPGPFVEVDDTLRALGRFAHWYRQQRETLVIGVTGSVGKTTTREMLYAVLSARHAGVRSSRNFNNEIGLPLSLLELRDED